MAINSLDTAPQTLWFENLSVNSPDFLVVMDIRNRVLNRPHNEPDQIEPDAIDLEATHRVGRDVYTGRIDTIDRIVGLGRASVDFQRVGVRPEVQGGGKGKAMLWDAHELVETCRASEINLMARDGTQGFYKKSGYEFTGLWGTKGPFMKFVIGKQAVVGTLED